MLPVLSSVPWPAETWKDGPTPVGSLCPDHPLAVAMGPIAVPDSEVTLSVPGIASVPSIALFLPFHLNLSCLP